MKILLMSLTIIFFNSCAQSPSSKQTKSKKTIKKEEKINSCICMEIYNPVCGNDGQTYTNSCEAKCKKVRYKNGECR